MTPEQRINEIAQWLEASKTAWPFFAEELRQRIATHTADLIGTDNEQTRGRIKALAAVLELPQTLSSELEGIRAGLSEPDPAD